MRATRRTPLYEIHRQLGGKIIEFGGWELPVQYQNGILAEHQGVRERAGLFDVSHMGEFLVAGPEARLFLQTILTNDVSRARVGQAVYSPMCFPTGGVVDDLLIYRLGEEKYMAVVNAANIDTDWLWMNDHAARFKVNLTNISGQTAEIALQGPASPAILSTLTAVELEQLKYYRFLADCQVAGKPVLLSRTGYTGEDGFEIYCRPEDAAAIWQSLMTAGKEQGVTPAGLGCRDTLRFEACLPLYGHELSKHISPVEAGLGRYVKLEKTDFIGRAELAKQKADGPARKLAGFKMLGRGIPRHGYRVLADGQEIGMVTTGSFAPTLGENLGLALVKAGYATLGETFDVEIRGKLIPAQVIERPFYKRKEIEK